MGLKAIFYGLTCLQVHSNPCLPNSDRLGLGPFVLTISKQLGSLTGVIFKSCAIRSAVYLRGFWKSMFSLLILNINEADILAIRKALAFYGFDDSTNVVKWVIGMWVLHRSSILFWMELWRSVHPFMLSFTLFKRRTKKKLTWTRSPLYGCITEHLPTTTGSCWLSCLSCLYRFSMLTRTVTWKKFDFNFCFELCLNKFQFSLVLCVKVQHVLFFFFFSEI